MPALVLCSIKSLLVILGTGSWWVDSHPIPLPRGHSLHGLCLHCMLPGIQVTAGLGMGFFYVSLV